MELYKRASEIQEDMVAWRRDIHMHPELGFEEKRTANLVVQNLREMGIEAEVGVGRTGVVARIGDGNGPKVGIRADMDALPIQEANDVPYKSQTPGLMHACGHDAHTAILMGVARILNDMADRPAGEVRLLFQPSEEKWGDDGISGATAMIQDSALEDLDAVIALHVASGQESGTVEVGDGYVAAAVDSFFATIKGEGTHGAHPDRGVDPIWISAQVINAIQAIRSRRTDPTTASVVTIGAIHGGTATNIIPHEVTFMGTIRTFDEDLRDQIHEELHRAFSVAKTLGGDYELEIQRGYPAMYNAPEVSQLLRDVAAEAIGEDKVKVGTPMMGAEDFSYMTQKAPGAMFMLGVKYDDLNRPHHSPIFDIDENPMQVGAAVLAETAVRLLKQHAK
ncbi:amidohydrolase [Phototrophicus methaneseepsis]|uniref:Amidohydrolase n=1 Tax=Phototrophicus methaneseepsis TaxID=2710758 RepID=A0A7S8EDK7_9CHLR|nr:amidohydrolase [Phototrophicus methaneseepsis]QPC85015.1 amidohydrolase [Phototrophicus methaneseepsis]